MIVGRHKLDLPPLFESVQIAPHGILRLRKCRRLKVHKEMAQKISLVENGRGQEQVDVPVVIQADAALIQHIPKGPADSLEDLGIEDAPVKGDSLPGIEIPPLEVQPDQYVPSLPLIPLKEERAVSPLKSDERLLLYNSPADLF